MHVLVDSMWSPCTWGPEKVYLLSMSTPLGVYMDPWKITTEIITNSGALHMHSM